MAEQSIEQLTFDTPAVISANLTVGAVSETDHMQFTLTILDESGGRLLVMESCPHFTREDWRAQLTVAFGRLLEHIEHLQPHWRS